ncbi:MAG: hypothetical protein CMJ76_10870 [Planctomycetaceae bacterium]|nr:hypothetical protein [Planctomycetaceae bacterium]
MVRAYLSSQINKHLCVLDIPYISLNSLSDSSFLICRLMQHIYAVSTIKEMQKFNPLDSTQLRVAGYHKPGDGGGGEFHWVAGDKSTADNGLVFRSATDAPGRWHRIGSGYYDVREFGVFSASGDVTNQLQRALDACRKGGSVYIPAGHYTVSDPLMVHQSTSIIGDGLFTEIHYYGQEGTACWNAAQRSPAISLSFRSLNTLVYHENTYAFRLTGMSYSRFDLLFVHLREKNTSAYYGPSNGESPYYNVYTNCHASGPGGDENGCVGFDWGAHDDDDLAPNANQVFGGHINSVDIAVRCQGTGNIFHGQVFEMVNVGYEFDLPAKRYTATNQGISNDVFGLYTEYAKIVFHQKHPTCYFVAQTSMVTGHTKMFVGKSKDNCVLLSSHSGQLPMNRSFFQKGLEFTPLTFD